MRVEHTGIPSVIMTLENIEEMDIDLSHLTFTPLPYPSLPPSGLFARVMPPQAVRAYWAKNPTGYKRTYSLKKDFPYTVQSLGSSIVIEITAPSSHAKWVIGEQTQAAIHKGRWWTFRDMVLSHTAKITAAIIEGVRKLV